jgi:hypothetical protein
LFNILFGGIYLEKVTIPIFVFFLMLVLVVISILPVTGSYSFEGFDYAQALGYTITFYDGNRCGKDVEIDNVFTWRNSCHQSDGSNMGLDLTGGFHDDGDYNKTGILQAYSASMLGWSYYEYSDVYKDSENSEKILETLKIFTDYFIKCNQEEDKYICDVISKEAANNTNSTEETSEEDDSTQIQWYDESSDNRSRIVSRVVDSENPGSEVLGLAASALYLMSKNYREVDSEYADKCWDTAEKLFEMGKDNQGLIYTDGDFKTSTYNDDLAWAAVCKYLAKPDDKVADEAVSYLNKAKEDGENFEGKWYLNWDNVYLPAILVLSDINEDDEYKKIVENNINYWINDVDKTEGGLSYFADEGVLSFAAASSYISLVYSKYYTSDEFDNYAKSQIDYILGNNPYSFSYVIGFGLEWAKHPRHILANSYTATNNDYRKEAKYILTGALLSGPDKNDEFEDDVDDEKYTKVEIDYNANLVAALSALEKADQKNRESTNDEEE